MYERECGPDNPLRCYVGDVGTRLGSIGVLILLNQYILYACDFHNLTISDLGAERSVFSDPNFPLERPVGAIGRSLVIFGPDFSGERFACANIEPDHNVIKYINLQKPPRFVV